MKKLGALLVILALSGLFVGCPKSGEKPAAGTTQSTSSTAPAGGAGDAAQPAGGAGGSQAPADAGSSAP